MKILYICDEFPPGKTGGIGIATSLLARELSGQGHQVYIAGLCAPGYGAPDYEEVNINLKVWRFRYASDIGLITSNDKIIDKIAVQVLRMSGILKHDAVNRLTRFFSFVENLIIKEGIEIIEMPDWNNYFFNLRGRVFEIPDLKIPLVIKMHGSHSYFSKLESKEINARMFEHEKALYQRASGLASVSNFTAEYCRSLYGLEGKIEVMYNGVEVSGFTGIADRENNSTVIFSGSLMEKKGIYSLVTAWNRVALATPGATLHIYGKGSAVNLKKLIRKEVEDTVKFYGHVSRPILIEALKKADLAVFPSFSETFGMSAAEAMGTGCPVIFTNRTSGPEIISNGNDGWLVDPGDPAMISETILAALNDNDKREKFGRAGYEKVKERFEISKIASRHIQFYEEIITKFSAALNKQKNR